MRTLPLLVLLLVSACAGVPATPSAGGGSAKAERPCLEEPSTGSRVPKPRRCG